MKKKNALLLVMFSFSYLKGQLDFNKVVIWGFKERIHTSHFIHNALYKACKHMGYDTYWFDDKEDVSQFDFTKSLFFTEGQVDKNIPIRDDCYYILHHCYDGKYFSLKKHNRALILEVYTRDVHFRNVKKIANCMYFDVENKSIFLPWATDLLPHEVDEQKKKVKFSERSEKIYYIGTLDNHSKFENMSQIGPFIKACRDNGVDFIHEEPASCSVEENINLINNSCMAPALQGPWQLEMNFVPCRIFKNISYGQMGITNSKIVYDLFDGKIVYNSDTYQLFHDAQVKINTMKIEELYELMDFVRDNHTYVSRITMMLDFFELLQDS